MFLFTMLCLLPVAVFLGILVANATGKNGWAYYVIMVVASLLIAAVIAGAFTADRASDENRWNNGICTVDGTELHFVNASATRSIGGTNTKYYYECENGHIYEFNYLYKNIEG